MPPTDEVICPECGDVVTGMDVLSGFIVQVVPCGHRVWAPTWMPAGS